MTRTDVVSQAADQCIKELYSLVQPKVEWDDFVKQNEEYSAKYKEWERFNHAQNLKDKNPDEWGVMEKLHPDWINKKITECIGPRPYEFYYLPQDVMKEICDSYVSSYEIDDQKNLLDTIEILKHYCDKPMKSKGKEFEEPDNIEQELQKILNDKDDDTIKKVKETFFNFLDEAGKFYKWTRFINSFNMTVYLGPSPNSNKKAVINNWKQYRETDIEINDDLYNEEDE
jgi:hypothetical protein